MTYDEYVKICNDPIYQSLCILLEADHNDENADRLSAYLDLNVGKMAKPRYPYEEKDVSTWKYIPIINPNSGKDVNSARYCSVPNTNYKYGK
jgi:hypothetical protein